MKIKDSIPDWPNLSIAESFAERDKMGYDPNVDTIQNIRIRQDGTVEIEILKTDGRSATAIIELTDPFVTTALLSCVGLTPSQAGEVEIGGSESA